MKNIILRLIQIKAAGDEATLHQFPNLQTALIAKEYFDDNRKYWNLKSVEILEVENETLLTENKKEGEC